MKNNVGIYSKCANCGACVNSCPVDAISVESKHTFYRIQINEDKCIHCGICVEKCPVNTEFGENKIEKAYGGFHKDEGIVSKSSSGGAFYAIAQRILAHGGIAFGAAYDEDYHSVVFKSTDEVPIEALMKSKYVESNVGDSFRRIKKELAKGRKVLFCGTPCQVAGLQKFIGCNDNLITCDFACGGLPSHKIFDEYIKEREKKYGAEVCKVDFRPKVYGWKQYGIEICFKNGREYRNVAELDPYFSSFVHHRSINRDYCYQCDFANHHVSDIILADFWLHNKISTLDNNDRGLSLILTNSSRGTKLIEEIAADFELFELSLPKAAYNIRDGHAKQETIDRQQRFVEAVNQDGFFAAYRKHYKMKLGQKIKLQLKALLKARRI